MTFSVSPPRSRSCRTLSAIFAIHVDGIWMGGRTGIGSRCCAAGANASGASWFRRLRTKLSAGTLAGLSSGPERRVQLGLELRPGQLPTFLPSMRKVGVASIASAAAFFWNSATSASASSRSCMQAFICVVGHARLSADAVEPAEERLRVASPAQFAWLREQHVDHAEIAVGRRAAGDHRRPEARPVEIDLAEDQPHLAGVDVVRLDLREARRCGRRRNAGR